MDVEINNVIYMELNSGPKISNSTCGKTIDVETIDRDSTVHKDLNDNLSQFFVYIKARTENLPFPIQICVTLYWGHIFT
jgi:hypothetical protein